jgi:hypothetical protein
MDFDAERGDPLALELAGDVSLHQSGLARAAVADEHHLEAGDLDCSCLHVGCGCDLLMSLYSSLSKANVAGAHEREDARIYCAVVWVSVCFKKAPPSRRFH